MTFQKYSNNRESGIVLVDVLLGISLGTLFISLFAQSTIRSRELFEYARERTKLLDVFEIHADEFANLMPYETKQASFTTSVANETVEIAAKARWYGNERIQTDVTVAASPSTTTKTLYRSPYTQSVHFSIVRSFPFQNPEEVAGTPLCAVDYQQKDTVGSYSFLQSLRSSSSNQPTTVEIKPISLPAPSNLPLTDIEIRNGIAYVSADSTSASDPDIVLFDIHDPDNAKLLSSLHTGPGISALTLAGNNIYAAAASTAAQLHVVRVDALNSLVLEAKYQLPLPYATATPPLASSIFYDKKYIYLGTEKWAGAEFSVIDVHNPTTPIQIGTFEVGTKINDLYARNSSVYVASSDQFQARTIDVSDKTHPFLRQAFTSSGWERQEGKSLGYFEDSLSFGRTSGGFNITRDHELFSLSTSTADFELNPPMSLDISGGIYGIIIDRNRVIVSSRHVGKEIQIFDRTLSTSTVMTFSLPVFPQAMTCEGTTLYVLGSSAPILYQITFI